MKMFNISRVVHGDREFAAARDAEFRVFGLRNEFASAADKAAGEILAYKSHEHIAEFYVARRTANPTVIVGVVRLIRHDPALGMDSFTTLRDANAYAGPGGQVACYLDPAWKGFFADADPAMFAELASQAIEPRWRRWGAMEEIWTYMVEVCAREGVRYWTVALTVPLFRQYKAMFPTALQAIGRVMPCYVGADSIPALFDIEHSEVRIYADYINRYWRGRCPVAGVLEG